MNVKITTSNLTFIKNNKGIFIDVNIFGKIIKLTIKKIPTGLGALFG